MTDRIKALLEEFKLTMSTYDKLTYIVFQLFEEIHKELEKHQ
jgi:hypothetical protein